MPSLFASSVKIGAMPAWAMSAGDILQEELAAAACFFPCLLLPLLQVVLLLHHGIHTRCRVPASVSPARGNVVSKGKEPRSIIYAPLGGSLAKSEASGKFSANREQLSNLISTTLALP